MLLLYSGQADQAAAAIDALPPVAGEHDQARVSFAAALPYASVGRASQALAAPGQVVRYTENPANAAGSITRRAALFVQASALTRDGRVRAARDVAIQALHEAIDHDDEIAIRHAEFTLGHCYLGIGRLETAGRWFRDAISGAEAKGPMSFRGPALGCLALSQLWQGDIAAGRITIARQAPEVAAWDIFTILGNAWIDCEQGGGATAITAVMEAAAGYQSMGYGSIAGWFLFNMARLGFAGLAQDPLHEIANRGDSVLFALRAAHTDALLDSDPGGRSLTAAHAGLGITDKAFDRMLEHLRSALSDIGVEQAAAEGLIARVQPVRSAIVAVSLGSATPAAPV